MEASLEEAPKKVCSVWVRCLLSLSPMQQEEVRCAINRALTGHDDLERVDEVTGQLVARDLPDRTRVRLLDAHSLLPCTYNLRVCIDVYDDGSWGEFRLTE